MISDKIDIICESLPLEESRGPFVQGLTSNPSAGDIHATPPENSLAEVWI
jgi:hypothetical protein